MADMMDEDGRVLDEVRKTAGMTGMTVEEYLEMCGKFAMNMRGDGAMPAKMMKATKMVVKIKGGGNRGKKKG